MTERRQSLRMAGAAVLLLLAWGGLSYRLWSLHHDPGLQARMRNTRQIEQEILVGRGRILDRQGNLLAIDLGVKHVNVDPMMVISNGQASFIARQLARVLQMDPAMVLDVVSRPGRRQAYVKKNVRYEEAQKLKDMGLDKLGLFFEEVSQRNYPNHELMSHVIGFSNTEGIGSAGVEQRFHQYLKGVPGLRLSEVDGKRREVMVRRSLEIQPQEGADVYLTLDVNVQYFCERALDRVMERHGAQSACAIVQEVRTGRILGMASRPTFDPSQYGKVSASNLLNRPIGMLMEPGSIFKLATIAAALDQGAVQPETVFDCENGHWLHYGKILRDHSSHGRLCVADILKVSSNIGAAKIAETMGEDRLVPQLKKMGFGRKIGVELPGEEGGILRQPGDGIWSRLSLSQLAMGHGVMTTPLQMVNFLSCIANNGFLMKPTILERVVSKDGTVLQHFEPEVVARPLRGDTAKLMCQMMTRVTEEGGTGQKARVAGYTVGGKTGTAQKFVNGHYSEVAHVASFMGVLPIERPEIAVLVVVDEPEDIHLAGKVAAPAFSEIAGEVARYLDIPPVPAEYAWSFGDRIPDWESIRKE